jgi:Flp pilus assembly protein TadD
LAQIAFDQSSSGGVNTDLEVAAFLTNHDRELPSALTIAESAALARPTITSADTLAWALYKNNRFAEAKNYSDLALRLGEHDPLIVFHAGMIAHALGDTVEAKRLLTKALELHPHFSIQYAPVARDTLSQL